VYCRFYLDPALNVPDSGGSLADVDISFGITDLTETDAGDFSTTDRGPCISIVRDNFGAGGPIDLQANFGSNIGSYSYVASVNGGGLTIGSGYDLWIDVYNSPDDTNNHICSYYSVYLRKDGDLNRTTLFSNQPSDRRGPEIGPLANVFLCGSPLLSSPQPTNVVQFDDFYLAGCGGNSSGPAAPIGIFHSGQVIITPKIVISNISPIGNSVSLTWSSTNGVYYSVQRCDSFSSAWVPLASRIPGNSPSTTYVDPTPSPNSAFYRVISP
jgi:hypothetical protein